MKDEKPYNYEGNRIVTSGMALIAFLVAMFGSGEHAIAAGVIAVGFCLDCSLQRAIEVYEKTHAPDPGGAR